MCNVNGSKKAKYKMAGIENSGYNPYALVALKTTKTSSAAPVAGEVPNTEAVDTSGDKVTISSSPRQEPTKAEALAELLLSHKTVSNADLSANLNSDDPEVSQKATEQYQVLKHLYNNPSNVKKQYAAFDQVYKDADGFIYIAGRGLEPYSNDGGKYPTQEALQKDADEALKQYLSVSSPITAESKLSHINATGKEPTPEEQVEIAELLKQEIEQGSLSKEEIKNIKSKLRDAHIGLIPDESPETQSLRKVVEGLVDDLNDLNSRNDFINQVWLNLTDKDTETATKDTETATSSSLNQQVKILEGIRLAREQNRTVVLTPEQDLYLKDTALT
jgi:hypothetical protein